MLFFAFGRDSLQLKPKIPMRKAGNFQGGKEMAAQGMKVCKVLVLGVTRVLRGDYNETIQADLYYLCCRVVVLSVIKVIQAVSMQQHKLI